MAKYSPETIIGLGNRGLFRAYLITTDINNDVKEVYRYINLHDLVDVFSNIIVNSVYFVSTGTFNHVFPSLPMPTLLSSKFPREI
jgi:hypothetical protein